MSKFEGASAIVTGGASGIGRALAEQLCMAGASVTIVDIDGPSADEVAAVLSKEGHRIRAAILDVADYDRLSHVVTRVAQDHGQLDLMFNNAGIGVVGEVQDMTIDHWRRALDVNLMGVVNGVAAAYPIMVAQGHGHIINTSSMGGVIPMPATVNYATAKFGIMGLSQSLRFEAELLGVCVSVVCPSRVDTPFAENTEWINLDREWIMENTIPGGMISATECARRILKGVAKNKAVINVGEAGFGAWVHRHFPFVTRALARRVGRQVSANRAAVLARQSRTSDP